MKKYLSALRKLGPFILGVVLGVDMGLGLLVFAFTTIFTQEVSVLNLAYCVFMAHAPDIDMFLYMIQGVKKKLRIPSHRVIGHHPLIILPLFLILGMWALVFFPVEKWVLQGIFLLTTHFLHDMTNTIGLHLFSPFTWIRWRLSTKGLHRVSLRVVAKEFGRKSTSFGTGGTEEFVSRTEPVEPIGIALVLAGITCSFFSFLIFKHHW